MGFRIRDVEKPASFPCVDNWSTVGRENQVVVAELEGSLLKSRSTLPYYMLAAWEAPAGLARFTALLLLWPGAWLLERLGSIKLVAWIALAGVKESDIRWIAAAVLPKFYAEDVHPETWRAVSRFGAARRYLLSANIPRIMLQPFASDYLHMHVLGSELQIHAPSGRATGFLLQTPPVPPFGDDNVNVLDVSLGNGAPFLPACKEGYTVAPSSRKTLHRPPKLCKPLVFHDGRLVKRPTPTLALFILLWLPFGLILACMRVIACSYLPIRMSLCVLRGLGVRLIVRGDQPSRTENNAGILFASTHRSLMDPVFISYALERPVTAVTFSLSRLTEITSPIPTIRLSRSKEKDASIMKKHLEQGGDLVVCPEGTTCREPFLLRFSALFAELSTCIVPVATKCDLSMFHATTARGFKGLDSFYFFLNPIPSYEITFFKQLPQCLTCAGGRTSHEVANFVQSILASTLGFKSTKFTRKDKYRALVGLDETTSAR